MYIKFSNIFLKQQKAAPQIIKIAWREALELFSETQQHPSLRNHALKDEYAGHRSININDDWRAIFIIQNSKGGKKKIIFKFIGTHKELYGK